MPVSMMDVGSADGLTAFSAIGTPVAVQVLKASLRERSAGATARRRDPSNDHSC